jgi:hypothetical protein
MGVGVIKRRDVLLAGSGLALGGCAAPLVVPPEALSGIRRIAIVTAFDPELVLTYTGFTVFENDEESVRVDWPLNAHAMTVARGLLSPRLTVVDVPVDPAAVVQTQRPPPLRDRKGALEKLLRERIPPGTVDAVAVIATTVVNASDYPLYGRNRAWPYGLRVTGALGMGFSRMPSAFLVAYGVTVLEGQNFKSIASLAPTSETAPPQRGPLLPDSIRTPPMVLLDFSWRGEPWHAVPGAQRETIRLAAPRLIDQSLPGALATLGLGAEVAPTTASALPRT